MRFTPGARGMVWSLRTAVVAQVTCDACAGELWNQAVLACADFSQCAVASHSECGVSYTLARKDEP